MPSPSHTDFAQVVERLRPGSLLVLASPNNPTGELVPLSALEAVAQAAQAACAFLVVDEAFVDFVDHPEAHSFRFRALELPHVAVVGSLTKFFALPGLRIGYLVAHPAPLAEAQRRTLPWHVNTFAQLAVPPAVADVAFARATRRLIAAERPRLAQSLADLGIAVRQGRANFLLLDFRAFGLPARTIQQRLLVERILIRDGSSFPGLSVFHARVAVRTPAEDDRLLGALRRVLAAGQGGAETK